MNPESKTALLFYEAYLFMLEAWYERMNIDSTGTRSISPKAAPTLLKSSLIGIPLQFYSVGNASKASIRGPRLDKAADYASYISEDTVVSDGFVEWYSSTPKKGVDSMLSKYTLKCYESSSPYYSMLYD